MAIVISLGVLTYGYDSAFIGTTITQKSFQSDFGLNTMSKAEQNAVSSNLTSICTMPRLALAVSSTMLTVRDQ